MPPVLKVSIVLCNAESISANTYNRREKDMLIMDIENENVYICASEWILLTKAPLICMAVREQPQSKQENVQVFSTYDPKRTMQAQSTL